MLHTWASKRHWGIPTTTVWPEHHLCTLWYLLSGQPVSPSPSPSSCCLLPMMFPIMWTPVDRWRWCQCPNKWGNALVWEWKVVNQELLGRWEPGTIERKEPRTIGGKWKWGQGLPEGKGDTGAIEGQQYGMGGAKTGQKIGMGANRKVCELMSNAKP